MGALGSHVLQEVIVSAGKGSMSTPEPDYRFAHLAPSCIGGSARFRHYYVLGQKPDYCALELAAQRGLLPTPQHRQQQESMPCSSTAADTTHEHIQAQEPDISCGGRTPVAQLRASHQHVEDSSPCNNIVRRLAADIKTGSASTLQTTLTEYSSFARRSTTSIRSRVSTHSDHSYDDDSTPLASPGRGWMIDAAAACPGTLEPGCHHDDAAMAPQLHHAVSAGHAAAELCTDKAAAAAAPFTQGQQTSDCGSLQSTASTGCSCEQETIALPHDLPAVAAAPSIHFKGFEAATVLQQALASTDSVQLNTPRLDLCWGMRPHSNGSNTSSSNGTENSMDEHDSTKMQQPAATSPETYRQVQPGNDCIQEGSACSPAIESDNESLPQGEHDATARAALALQDAALVAVPISSSDQQVVCKTRRSSSNIDESGFWSCDDDDDGNDHAACDSHTVLEDAVPMTALPTEHEEPCRLPLSPLLLKQLSQQLSFKEAAEDPGVKAYAASAQSDCEWATVCSYEETEQVGSS